LHAGTLNALDEIKRKIESLLDQDEVPTITEFKASFSKMITSYVEEKIVYAQEAMVTNGMSLLQRKKQTVMVFGQHTAMEKLFETANKEGCKFKLIIVDTCPELKGRAQVQRLSKLGIKCTYTLLQGIGNLLSKATLVCIGASYVLGNGGVVGPSGTSMLAYMA
jgi:translation initiation factor eIF-2B subunit delta